MLSFVPCFPYVHIVELDPYILQVQMSLAHNNTPSLSNADKGALM